jgi:hypothetical protein
VFAALLLSSIAISFYEQILGKKQVGSQKIVFLHLLGKSRLVVKSLRVQCQEQKFDGLDIAILTQSCLSLRSCATSFDLPALG